MPRNTNTSTPDEALLSQLGERLARERLRRNLTQAMLAAEAGVSRATVGRLENGESTQLANLIRVLRALGLARNLDALVPEPVASPLELSERQGRRRQRASSTRPDTSREKDSEKNAPKAPWNWGEDQ